LALSGLDDVTANRAMTAALGSPYDVSGAAHLPHPALRAAQGSARGALAGLASTGRGATLLRLEGIAASVAHRAATLAADLASFATVEFIEDAESAALWRDIRDVTPFAAGGTRGAWPVWRIVCPPASGAAFGQALARETGGEVLYDWGGGLLWAALPPAADAHAALLRRRLAAIGGHATLLRADEGTRRAVDVFHPQANGVAALAERVRQSFDPKNILNRGRLTRTPIS
ncbi:MAG TPA: FAD-linked oxidase C-terminal domain-containing protein, partial [Nitrobacter sp.]|nr:FAD-linked oxidase C-terminal domain-containing protein [Nitrobacter sp.]